VTVLVGGVAPGRWSVVGKRPRIVPLHVEVTERTPMSNPEREIRAYFDIKFVRVYQAYSNEIADSALASKRFVSPPFSFSRMTWIKPSFLWMMYRAGWAKKDAGQQRILAIDITHDGFEWALAHSCASHREPGVTEEVYKHALATNPVRVQWDPERSQSFTIATSHDPDRPQW
jgi:hypothetical protein